MATSFLPTATLSAQGSIAGTITDSIHHRPLEGALVQVVGDSSKFTKSVNSDSLGRFRFDSVPPGSYIIGFFHPALDSLGLELSPKRIAVRQGDEFHADLDIPSAWTVETQLCRGTPMRDSTGLLLGHIRDADTQQPRAGTVTVIWVELSIGKDGMKQVRQQIPAKSDALGWFALCGVPSDADLSASALAGDEQSGWVAIHVPAGGLLMRDFLVSRADSTISVYAAGDTTPAATRVPVATLRRGTARLSGVVRDYKGKPVNNASVSVPGTGLEARTQSTGAYSLSTLPSGTQAVEVRVIGLEPKTVSVDLARNHLTTLDITLDRPVQTLDAVKVYGTGNSRIAEFERRVKAGWGHILTPADIEKRHAIWTTELFRTIPGVQVARGRFGNVVLLRNCRPTVYLNGMRLDDSGTVDIDQIANPDEITGIEVYTSANRPVEFWGNNCGTVVIWAGMLPR
ncbi:MAG TPA: carboxypeptidase regulatory-like domain-containing protein [Gemmatimonadaceae bacterium]|nr:carboxypeptidase regulatory-like domain-containing protein [Gemmatimonadaceae bacterium]